MNNNLRNSRRVGGGEGGGGGGERLEHKKNIFIKMNDFVLARPNGRRFVGGPPIPSSPLRLFPLCCCCCFACSCMCTDVSFFLLLLRLLDAAGLIKKKRARRIRMEHDAKFISG